jgi:hypothetical protein
MDTGSESSPCQNTTIDPKGKGRQRGLAPPTAGNALGEGSSALPIPEASKNPFEILSNPPEISDPMIEELEQQILSPTIGKNNVEIHSGSPIGASSSPSYADIIKKKPPEISGSSEDESFERPSKRAGRKSHKEAREEEAERQKMQGSQPTIEMSIGRNTRTRPPKGGPPHSSK